MCRRKQVIVTELYIPIHTLWDMRNFLCSTYISDSCCFSSKTEIIIIKPTSVWTQKPNINALKCVIFILQTCYKTLHNALHTCLCPQLWIFLSLRTDTKAAQEKIKHSTQHVDLTGTQVWSWVLPPLIVQLDIEVNT